MGPAFLLFTCWLLAVMASVKPWPTTRPRQSPKSSSSETVRVISDQQPFHIRNFRTYEPRLTNLANLNSTKNRNEILYQIFSKQKRALDYRNEYFHINISDAIPGRNLVLTLMLHRDTLNYLMVDNFTRDNSCLNSSTRFTNCSRVRRDDYDIVGFCPTSFDVLVVDMGFFVRAKVRARCNCDRTTVCHEPLQSFKYECQIISDQEDVPVACACMKRRGRPMQYLDVDKSS